MPPPPNPAADEAHQALLQTLDLNNQARSFRSQTWKPNTRRNKNIKQILTETSRKEAASYAATQNNSGSSTPIVGSGSGAITESATPGANGGKAGANIAQAAQSLSTLVLERNTRAAFPSGPSASQQASAPAISVTYTNIESAPSLSPANQKRYCDITGLPASYTDPKTRLRYADREVFGVIRSLPQGVAEQYLGARGAAVVLK